MSLLYIRKTLVKKKSGLKALEPRFVHIRMVSDM